MGFAPEWPLVVDAKCLTPGALRVVSGSAFSPATPVNSNQRFPRARRLTSSEDFSQALKRADFRKRLGPVQLICRKNQMHLPRLGLIVGKRAVAKAAERNRIKRVIRDHFRCHQEQLGAYDLVVQVTHNVGSTRLRALLVDGFSLLETSDVLTKPNAGRDANG